MIATREAAIDALQSALADVDNKVGAARTLGRVAGQFSPAAPTSWLAFQYAAEKLLEPWFKAETQAVVWTNLDRDFGLVESGGDPGHLPPTVSHATEPSAFPGPSTTAHLMRQPEPEVLWLAEGLIPAGGTRVRPTPLASLSGAGSLVPPRALAEHRRLARGWRRTLEVCGRIRRREEGRPVLELVKDSNPARARASG